MASRRDVVSAFTTITRSNRSRAFNLISDRKISLYRHYHHYFRFGTRSSFAKTFIIFVIRICNNIIDIIDMRNIWHRRISTYVYKFNRHHRRLTFQVIQERSVMLGTLKINKGKLINFECPIFLYSYLQSTNQKQTFHHGRAKVEIDTRHVDT